MPQFELKKQMIFEASLIVEAADGLAAARMLHDWKPDYWTMCDGDYSSVPYVDMDTPYAVWAADGTRPEYEVRGCRGHFHVMRCGEDLAIDGDPFKTREEAEAACVREAAQSVPNVTPRPASREDA